MAKIITAYLRDLTEQVDAGEITYGCMIKLLNKKANEGVQPVSFDSFTDELHLRLEYHISIGNNPRMALTLALADCQYLYPAAQPVVSEESMDIAREAMASGIDIGMAAQKELSEKKAQPVDSSHSDKDVDGKIKKYQTFISNIEWHIKTNNPTGYVLAKADLYKYKDVIKDLEELKAAQSSPVEAAQPQQQKERASDIIKGLLDSIKADKFTKPSNRTNDAINDAEEFLATLCNR